MFGTVRRDEEQAVAQAFARDGLVRIASFLPDATAATLHAELRTLDDWRQVFKSGDKLFELDRATRQTMDRGTSAKLDQAIYAGARSGFQYRYETIRAADDAAERNASSDPQA